MKNRFMLISLTGLCIFGYLFVIQKKVPPAKDLYIEAGQSATQEFLFKAGYTYKLVVDQCGVDVVPTATSPEGRCFELDRHIDTHGPEFLWILPDKDETWTLSLVASSENIDSFGYYTVSIEEFHKRCADDYELLKIQEQWFEARLLHQNPNTANALASIYNDIISFYIERGDNSLAADYALEVLWSILPQGKVKQALDYGNLAIELYSESDNADGLAFAYYCLGYLHDYLFSETKNPDHALRSLRSFFKCWAINRSLGRIQDELPVATSIGGALKNMGMYEEALSITKQTAESLSEGHNNTYKASLLSNLASIYYSTFNDIEQAVLQATKAEETLKEIDPKFVDEKIITTIATIYSGGGQEEKAAKLFEKAETSSKKYDINSIVELKYHQASNLSRMSKDAEALDILGDIIKISSDSFKAKIYLVTAQIQMETDPESARINLQKADEAFGQTDQNAPMACFELSNLSSDPHVKEELLEKSMRKAERLRSLYSNQNLRTGVFDRYFKIYASAIENYMAQSRKPNDSFVAKAFNILEQASGKSLRESTLLGINKSRAEIDINALYRNDPAAWRALEHHLTRKVENVGDGASTLQEIQRGMGPNTLLLMTFLRPEHSYIWYVWEDGYRAIRSKSNEEFERLVLAFRQSIEQGSPDLLKSDVGHELYNALFPPDLPLDKFKRLAVVVDDALTLLPFAALPSRDQHYLVENLDIVYLPTASHAAKQPSYAKPRATKAIGLFANPIFKPTDSRLRQVLSSEEIADEVKRSPPDRLELSRLEGTEAEAEAILSLPSLAHQSTRAYRGFEATRSAALDHSLRDYRMLHFATHCQIDNLDSSQSKLILSCYDAQGQAIRGELTMADITELQLHADLVVLSACETALGRRVRGAGPMSLSRGFMLAGVPRVAATLWSIDDKASPTLMKNFYTAMLEQGKSPGAALSQAQRQMLSEPRWNHPKYWSAFILLGDWR